MKRRKFINRGATMGTGLLFLGTYACKQEKKKETPEVEEQAEIVSSPELFFKLSLAQWSINKMIREGGVDPYTFAEKAKALGFNGLEYVSGLYYPELEAAGFSEEAMKNFVDKSNAEAEKHGMENVLIMIDRQGNLAAADTSERNAAVENHYKWVDAAQAMGCHSIRVNLNGSTEQEEWTNASVDGLKKLATYAQSKNINVIVENHGGFSSNGALLANVMTKVAMDNCGTLPDFGNFCMEWAEWPECNDWYDRYKGTTELMPFAKAVSAKSHDFDENGNEINTDYVKMLEIVKNAGYTGYIGVEYEGTEIGEEQGIIATRDLLVKVGQQMS
ncbi:MAG: sugar phosphate isomerase/epimerase family protein [Croceivirga sp.]